MFSHLDTYTRPEPQQSALITIDLQNDFCLPGAPAEGEGALKAAQQAALAVNLYRELGLPIFMSSGCTHWNREPKQWTSAAGKPLNQARPCSPRTLTVHSL